MQSWTEHEQCLWIEERDENLNLLGSGLIVCVSGSTAGPSRPGWDVGQSDGGKEGRAHLSLSWRGEKKASQVGEGSMLDRAQSVSVHQFGCKSLPYTKWARIRGYDLGDHE